MSMKFMQQHRATGQSILESSLLVGLVIVVAVGYFTMNSGSPNPSEAKALATVPQTKVIQESAPLKTYLPSRVSNENSPTSPSPIATATVLPPQAPTNLTKPSSESEKQIATRPPTRQKTLKTLLTLSRENIARHYQETHKPTTPLVSEESSDSDGGSLGEMHRLYGDRQAVHENPINHYSEASGGSGGLVLH